MTEVIAKQGDKTAMQIAMASAPSPEPEPEQLDLLGLPEPPVVPGEAPLPVKHGPGRPPGARNKRTEEMVEYLMTRYTDPREGLLQLGQTSVAELVRGLGCSPLEALQEKRLAWAAVLPYIAQKQPLAVNVNNKQLIHISIIEGEPPPAADGSIAHELSARVVEPGPIIDIEPGEGTR